MNNRLLWLGLGAVTAILVIAGLGAVLDDTWAKLVLDRRPTNTIYPLTIQNLMTLLFFVGVGDVIYRRREATREGRVLAEHLLPEDERTILRSTDLQPYLQKAQAHRRQQPSRLTALIEQGILKFQAGESVADSHQVLTTLGESEMHRNDLDYTLLRYFAWLIPTLGFIGTVVGIAGALAALEGPGEGGANMAPVIDSLALAFNSTIVALTQSAVLVLLIQFTQKKEELAINAAVDYTLKHLINRLHVPR